MPQKQKDSSFLGDVKQTPINSSMPVRSTGKQLLIGLLALAVIAGLGFGGFKWYKMRHPGQTVTSNNKNDTSVNNTATSTEYNPSEGELQLVKATVAWQKPTATKDLGFLVFSSDIDAQTIKDYNLKIEYYLVGSFTSGPYKGGQLYNVYRLGPGPVSQPDRIRLAVLGKDAFVLARYSDYYGDPANDPSIKDKIKLDSSLSISDLDIPKTITSLDGTKTLQMVNGPNGSFNDKNLVKAFDSKELGSVYAEAQGKTPAFAINPDGPSTYGFYAKAPDGTVVTYAVQPPFLDPSNYGSPAKITWVDGGKNIDDYTFQVRTGCGGANYADVVTDVSSDKGLVVTGKTEQGDTVYEYSDTNAEYLKKIYNEDYKIGREDKDLVSYDAYVKQHPVFFWRDGFGRYIRFVNNKFMALAECAKPVIYLYPPKTEKVNVTFGDGVTLTYTEPKYNNGWVVTAEPNGTLTTQDGKVYPYLFWEGRGLIYEAPKQGFMVKREDLDSFLSDKLAKLGLIEKEITDFKAYWLPLMQEKPYYFVGFHTQSYLNKLIPENVTPKPDTVIRLLMDFTGLDKPIKVVEPNIFTPTRKGFTLVEWGGVRR